MKLFKTFFIASFVLLAMAAGAALAGPIGGLAGASLAYTGLQLSGHVETPDFAFFTTLAVGNIKRKNRQLDNLGGFTKMAIILPEAFTTHWPLKADITGGKITEDPPLASGQTFGNLVIDLDSGNMKSSAKGPIENRNHSHEVAFKLSGATLEQLNELEKTKGGCLIIGWDADGVKWLAGSTRRPLQLEYDVNLGTKPDDKKEVTGKANRDGFPFHLLQFDDAVVLPLATLTELD